PGGPYGVRLPQPSAMGSGTWHLRGNARTTLFTRLVTHCCGQRCSDALPVPCGEPLTPETDELTGFFSNNFPRGLMALCVRCGGSMICKVRLLTNVGAGGRDRARFPGSVGWEWTVVRPRRP